MTEVTTTGKFPQPRAAGCPYQPPPKYQEFFGKGVLQKVELYDGRWAWLVTSLPVARDLFSDKRLSSDRTRDDFPFLSPVERTPRPGRMYGELDGEEHDAQRRMLGASFGVRYANDLRPRIQELTDGLIDDMIEQGPPVDLVTALSVQLPMMVVCQLFGIPYEDHEFFRDRGYRLAHIESAETVRETMGDLIGYLDRLVSNLEGCPAEGLMSELVHGPFAAGELDRTQLLLLGLVMLNSGHVTTSSMISLSVFTLLDHPEQLALLREDPSLWPQATEELMRYLSIADLSSRRIAAEDIEIAGEVIKAGEGVIMPNALLNRDPDYFDDPNRFDITRDKTSHLAFGFGQHQCPGKHLGRVEVETVLRTLFDRLPSLRLAVPREEVPLRDMVGLQGVNELPVEW
jgi:cytochrome P450